MKIVHVTKKYPKAIGGDAVVVSNLQKEQEAAGHHVSILTSNCNEIVRGENIYRFGLVDTPAALDSITPRRLISLIFLLFKAFRVFAKERPDVIHTHSIDMAFFVSFAAHFYRIPLVHTFHIVTFYDKEQAFLRRKTELLLARGARLQAATAPNQHDVAKLQAAGLGHTVLLPNGVDVTFWKQTQSENDQNEFLFLSVGRLEEQKGYDFLIKAAALLAKRANQPFRMIVIGDGGLKTTLLALAESLGIAERIEFVGRKTPEEVRQLLAKANAFVVPSLYETTPLTLLEAWAAKVPVVASRVGILRDAPLDHTVYLVQPKDERSLMEGMQLCMNDTARRATTAAAGHQEVQKYAWPRVTQTAEAIYGSLA